MKSNDWAMMIEIFVWASGKSRGVKTRASSRRYKKHNVEGLKMGQNPQKEASRQYH